MNVFRYKIGDFDCTAIKDGFTREIETSSLFANAPQELLEEALREHNQGQDRVLNPVTCLVVQTDGHQVLVDTGGGPGALPQLGKLLQNLAAGEIDVQEIDTVILTHWHWDHVGGNTDEGGEPSFPNANYVMWREEWDTVTSDKFLENMDAETAAFIRQNLLSIQDRVELIDREGEILPGVEVVAAPGHTVGHMAVAFHSGGEQLLCLGDAAIHPIHTVCPAWHTDFDVAPEQAVRSRSQLLERAVADGALLFAPHFPFPGVGPVARIEGGWLWQPMEKVG